MKNLFSKVALLSALFAAVSFAQNARVRVLHASPDAPNVDIAVDGRIALQDLPYGQATDYVSLPAGQRSFTIFVAGTETQVTTTQAVLTSGVDYTIVAAGFAAANKTPGFRVIALQDNNLPPDNADNVKLRVIHLAPSAPTVDVYATAPYLALRDRQPTLSAVPFGTASGYLEVPAGRWQARLTPVGSKTVAATSPNVNLPRNSVRTILAVDKKDGGAPFEFIVLGDRN
jgi:hypothetical protein